MAHFDVSIPGCANINNCPLPSGQPLLVKVAETTAHRAEIVERRLMHLHGPAHHHWQGLTVPSVSHTAIRSTHSRR